MYCADGGWSGSKAASEGAEQPLPEIPGYEVLEKLGEGGMGMVVRVREPRLNRHLALKVLPGWFRNETDRVRRFVEGAQITGQLQHPGIAPIHELLRHSREPFELVFIDIG